MKTKEAIEFLEEEINYVDYVAYKTKCIEGVFERKFFEDKRKEVIKLLKNGKKYKQIIEDVEQYIIDRRTIEEDFATNGKEIIDLIDWLKRKYFSELAEKTTTLEDIENRLKKVEKKADDNWDMLHRDPNIRTERRD